MKSLFIGGIYTLISLACFAQPGNSFAEYYKKHDLSLNYSYDDISQTHHYDNNWDLDGDGKMDSISFIGNGGAHLYFYPRIKLSSNNKVAKFPFLLLDFPVLGNKNELDSDIAIFPQFVVYDFDGDKLNEIYLKFDHSYEIPIELKKRGINSKQVLLKYKKGKIVILKYHGKKG